MKRNNKGSTIIIVLIALAFGSILGTVLLFTSYTGYQMKVLERGSKVNFYDAEQVLNEIRTGIQGAASDAVADAYSKVLIEYNTALASPENYFKQEFKTGLYAWRDAGSRELLRYLGPSAVTYNTETLSGFVSDLRGVTVAGSGIATVSAEDIVLKGVDVACLRDGYATHITTDIRIALPDFKYTPSEVVLTAVPDFTVIAKNELLQESGGAVVVDGNAYAGKIEVRNTSNKMLIGEANSFICKGDLTVGTGAEFGVSNPAKSYALWVNGIRVERGARLNLTQDVYVADDLRLADSGASATLSGRYFGFGNSLTDPTRSSSILVSAKGTGALDMSGLRSLMLGGTSFVSGTGSSNVLMGQSVAVKSDQLAYLAPVKSVEGGKNPCIYLTDALAGVDLAAKVNLASTVWEDKTLGSYVDGVQVITYPLAGNQTLVYYYLRFASADKANAYFRDYFSHNGSEISAYTAQYTADIQAAEASKTDAAGNVIEFEANTLTLSGTPTAISPNICTRLQRMFSNLCTTLSSNIGGTGDVYDYIVNADKMNALTGTLEFTNEGGAVVAVISKNPIAIDRAFLLRYPNIKVVVTSGRAEVSSTGFTGLVISGDTIQLRESLKADRVGVSDAFQSKATVDGANVTLFDYLKVGSELTETPGGIEGGVLNWDLENMVKFVGWSKK